MDDLFHNLVSTGHGTPTRARSDGTATPQQGMAFGAAFTAVLDVVTIDADGNEIPPSNMAEVMPDVLLIDADNGSGSRVMHYGPHTVPEHQTAVDIDTPIMRPGTAPDAAMAVPSSPINIAINAQIADGPQVMGGGIVVLSQPRPNSPSLDGPLTLPTAPIGPSPSGTSWSSTGSATSPSDTPSSLAQSPQAISPVERQIYGGPSVLPTAHTMDRADQKPPIGPLVLPPATQPTPLTTPVAPRGEARGSANEQPLTIPTDGRSGPQSQPLTIPTSTVRPAVTDGPQTLPVADRHVTHGSGNVPGNDARGTTVSMAQTSPTAPAGPPQTPTLTGAQSVVPTQSDALPRPTGSSGDIPGRAQTSPPAAVNVPPSQPAMTRHDAPESPKADSPATSPRQTLASAQTYSTAPPATPTTNPQVVEMAGQSIQNGRTPQIASTPEAAPSSDAPSPRDGRPARTGGWTVAPTSAPAPFVVAPAAAQPQPILANVMATTLPDSLADPLPELEFSLQAALSNISTTALTPTTSLFTQAPSATAQVIAQQISAALNNASARADSPLELALDPPELGRVRMQMTEISGVMTLTIQAERPETADLMRRHLDLLAQEFAEAGLDAPSVHISQEGADHHDQQQRDTSSDTAPAQAGSPDADTPPRPSHHSASGGLDLRL